MNPNLAIHADLVLTLIAARDEDAEQTVIEHQVRQLGPP